MEEAEEQIFCVANEIRRLIEINPKGKEIYLVSSEAIHKCGINYKDLESIIERLEEMKMLTSHRSYFSDTEFRYDLKLIPSQKFNNLFIRKFKDYSRSKTQLLSGGKKFIEEATLKNLRKISSDKFDLKRLVKMCEELNDNSIRKNFIAVIPLTRAIIDHVAPIFSVSDFGDVAKNYKGTRSFKELMGHLNISSRKIADSYLHTQIRRKEHLPSQTEVNFSNELEVLLGEIIRILK